MNAGSLISCGCAKNGDRTSLLDIPEPEKGTRHIPLTKGKWTVVDEDDFDRCSALNWSFCSTNGYAVGSSWIKAILMHRFVILAPSGIEVDHKNGNRLDNRRKNLRLCTSSQNRYNIGLTKANKSGFKGVSWSSAANKWVATIKANRVKFHLGCFLDPVKAHAAYCAAAVKLHGEFARFS